MIVETEAYSQAEASCHGHKKRSPKNETLFGPAGRLYISLTYGVYFCVNIVTDRSEWANGVLIRSLAIPNQQERIASGPGLLARYFKFSLSDDNLPITGENGFWIIPKPKALNSQKIVNSTRIGISKAKELRWRWYLQSSRSVSKRAQGDKLPSLSKAWCPNLNDWL